MTTLNRTVQMPDFPVKPHDGYQVCQPQDDGSTVCWTYNAALNEWTSLISGLPSVSRVYSENVILSRPVSEAVQESVAEYKIQGPSVIGDPTGKYGQNEANELFLHNDTDLQEQVDRLNEKVESLRGGSTATLAFKQAKARSSVTCKPGYFYTSSSTWDSVDHIMIGFQGWDDYTPIEAPKSGWLRVTDASSGAVVHYQKIASAHKSADNKLKLDLSADDKLMVGGSVDSSYVLEVIGVFSE